MTRTETDPYELFAVGELLGPGYGFMRVYIEDRPTSWRKKRERVTHGKLERERERTRETRAREVSH